MSDIGARVRISDPKHPHYNRIGEWRGAKKLVGVTEPMGEIRFTDQGPGIGGPDGCFVNRGQIELLRSAHECPKCGRAMAHYRLKGYRCLTCD